VVAAEAEVAVVLLKQPMGTPHAPRTCSSDTRTSCNAERSDYAAWLSRSTHTRKRPLSPPRRRRCRSRCRRVSQGMSSHGR
jgi:hypothetical protein